MNSVLRRNRIQCLLAMIGAAAVVICVCVGVTMNLTTVYDENFDHMGIRTFCMYTVDSGILEAIALMMVLPYTVDGLRCNNYRLPKWVVVLNLAGATGVTLTFLVALFLLSPVKGFVLIFTGSRFFLHGVCPVLAFITFCFLLNGCRISVRESLPALLPTAVYSVVYFVMVVVIGEQNGGWNDFYGFATRMPVWIPLLAVLPVTFGIAAGLRLLYNRSYDRRKARGARPDGDCPLFVNTCPENRGGKDTEAPEKQGDS
nr:hypothetical protein [Lachnospiraceae bacterium]